MLFGAPNIEKLKQKRDVKGLAKAIDRRGHADDKEVQLAAVAALEELGEDAAIATLVDTAMFPARWTIEGNIAGMDGEVSLAAARSLAAIGPHAVQPLVAKLADPDPRVIGAAARALGEIRWRQDGVPDALTRLEPQLAEAVESEKKKQMETWAKTHKQGWEPDAPPEQRARHRLLEQLGVVQKNVSRALEQIGEGEPERPEAPRCAACGRVLEATALAERAPTIGGSLPTLYSGVVCTACHRIECTDCKGTPVDAPCSSCGQAVEPAYEHLV